MEIIGFVGPSGTGKSHRALWVAKERQIEFVVDDGLLINENRIVAGTSAKKEKTRIASIKRALFIDAKHVNEVKGAIDKNNPQSIMIIGTSDNMVDTIAKNLKLPKPREKIYIHELASDFEIKQAIATRNSQGKHVIPVPTFEIKKDFSGYFLDPLQIFRRKGVGSYQIVGEKSVVRPTFSYLGKYTISDYAIYQIIEHCISKIQGIEKISRFRAENHPEGIYIEIDLVLIYGFIIKPLLKYVQEKVKDDIENFTALNIKTINVTAKSIVLGDKS